MVGRRLLLVSLVTVMVLASSGCSFLVRLSQSGDGTQASGTSEGPALSADGRYAVFASNAPTLVPLDTNGGSDVFFRDLQAGTIERVSIADDESEGIPGSVFGRPALSADGRYIAFAASMPNLVAEDENGVIDIFVRDRFASTTERVSVATGGAEAHGASGNPVISDDGNFVAFVSSAPDLVPDDDNGFVDAFVHDRQNDTTTRVSVASDGTEANGPSEPTDVFDTPLALSATGRFVVFASSASNLVSGDLTNGAVDVFLHDLQSSSTERISVASDESGANAASDQPSVSDDGRYVAFRSQADNLDPADTNPNEDVFVRDPQLGVTSVESQGTAPPQAVTSQQPALNGDGRWLAFRSSADNLVPGDSNVNEDIFVKDIGGNNAIRRVSLTGGDGQADSFSGPHLAISSDGFYVGFMSDAVNLVTPDTNETSDVFVRYARTPDVTSASPQSIARGTTTTLTVQGSSFVATPMVSASMFTKPGVTVNSVTFVTESQLQVSVTVAADAPTGRRVLTVINAGTGPGSRAGGAGVCDCLRVT
jgi:Tol biopolymer transport system component